MNAPIVTDRGKQLRAVLFGLFAVALIVLGLLVYRVVSLEGKQAIAKFFDSNAAEDQLMDPLILAGREVVEPLLKEVMKKDMPRRRYAILALGNIGDPSVIEPLQKIALDPAEVEHVRCDALAAIALLDESRAQSLAERAFPSGMTCIKNAASARRTYWEALLGLHW